MSEQRHRLVITSPTGLPQDATFTIDGQPIAGLCEMDIRIRPDELITVTMKLEPSHLTVDAALIERVLVSPTEERADTSRIGESS